MPQRNVFLNICPIPYVYSFVSPFRLLAPLLAVSAFAADTQLESLLKTVENRYNKAKTLQVLFKEEYTPAGKTRRSETGLLMLRKPGKMRWDYSQPKGKLVVSDGKYFWLYNPAENRAEKIPFKETDDMRAPLAFLLGKLNFNKELRNLKAVPEGDGTRIWAEPKSDNLPWSAVEFLVAPDGHFREVKVTGFDQSILVFQFDQERLNPDLNEKLFQFQPPKGAEVIEGAQ